MQAGRARSNLLRVIVILSKIDITLRCVALRCVALVSAGLSAGRGAGGTFRRVADRATAAHASVRDSKLGSRHISRRRDRFRSEPVADLRLGNQIPGSVGVVAELLSQLANKRTQIFQFTPVF